MGLSLVTLKQPEHVYGLQTRLMNQIQLRKGDTHLIRFAARSLIADRDTGSTKLRLSFGKATPNYDRSYLAEIGPGAGWMRGFD